MIPAQYSVIRYVPDPGRNEALNVGVLVWHDREWRVVIDDEAVKRVVRDSPWLATDALHFVAPMLCERLFDAEIFQSESILAIVNDPTNYPVWLTEPRQTGILAEQGETIDDTVARLVDRIVRPRRRGRRSESIAALLEQRLRDDILDRRVTRNYQLHGRATGVPRTVNFFANSGANVAVDALNLNISRSDTIRERADAEAFKVFDLSETHINRYVVVCDLNPSPQMDEINQHARRILESSGADVMTDLESAAQALLVGSYQ